MPFGLVYGLYDPRDGALRYVGQTTKTIEVRLKNHLNKTVLSKFNYRSIKWFRLLRSLGLKPVAKQLAEATSREELDRLEVEFLTSARSRGDRLCNHTDGGKGQSGRKCTFASRAKMSAAKKGRPGPMVGKKHSAESLVKIREANRRRGRLQRGSRNPAYRHNISTATILRRVVEGATRDQIALELGINLGLVAKRIAMARRDGIPVTRPKRKLPKISEAQRGKTGSRAYRYRHDISVEEVASLIRGGLSQRAVAKCLLVCRQLVQSRMIEAKQLGVI